MKTLLAIVLTIAGSALVALLLNRVGATLQPAYLGEFPWLLWLLTLAQNLLARLQRLLGNR